MYKIVGVVKHKNRIVAYDIWDGKSEAIRKSKADIIELIKNKQIINATMQVYKGNTIIRVTEHEVVKTRPVDIDNIKCKEIISGKEAINRLSKMEVGTPLRVRVYNSGEFEQVIYLGTQEVQNRLSHVFFNARGLIGYFALSSQYVLNNGDVINFKFNDNDPKEVSRLLATIKEGTFDLNLNN